MIKWFTDPGHAWLRVPVSLLREVGCAGKISAYSYLSPDERVAYLEEDCDAPVFLQAYHDMFGVYLTDIPVSHTDGDSFIRKLPRW